MQGHTGPRRHVSHHIYLSALIIILYSQIMVMFSCLCAVWVVSQLWVGKESASCCSSESSTSYSPTGRQQSQPRLNMLIRQYLFSVVAIFLCLTMGNALACPQLLLREPEKKSMALSGTKPDFEIALNSNFNTKWKYCCSFSVNRAFRVPHDVDVLHMLPTFHSMR